MLVYQLEQAPSEKRILQECYRFGRPVPEKFLNAPRLTIGLALYFDAFSELSNFRQIGFSEGPIQWEAINNYSTYHEFSEEQRDCLFSYVMALDRVYLSHQSKKISNGAT